VPRGLKAGEVPFPVPADVVNGRGVPTVVLVRSAGFMSGKRPAGGSAVGTTRPGLVAFGLGFVSNGLGFVSIGLRGMPGFGFVSIGLNGIPGFGFVRGAPPEPVRDTPPDVLSVL